MYSNKTLFKSDQSTLTQPLSPLGVSHQDSRERDDDSDALRCADVCNEDLEDEELEVDDEEDERTRPSEDEQGLYNRHEYLHCAVEDSGGARRSTSPSAERDDCSVTDTEEAVVAASPPVVPKPLPHPGVTLGGLHQPAGAGGPPCWGFPHGLATQFAWMPVYRSASPTSKYYHVQTSLVLTLQPATFKLWSKE